MFVCEVVNKSYYLFVERAIFSPSSPLHNNSSIQTKVLCTRLPASRRCSSASNRKRRAGRSAAAAAAASATNNLFGRLLLWLWQRLWLWLWLRWLCGACGGELLLQNIDDAQHLCALLAFMLHGSMHGRCVSSRFAVDIRYLHPTQTYKASQPHAHNHTYKDSVLLQNKDVVLARRKCGGQLTDLRLQDTKLLLLGGTTSILL